MEGNRRMGMVGVYGPFVCIFFKLIYLLVHCSLISTGCDLNIVLQVIPNSRTGSIADFACELEITEQVVF